MICNSSSTDVQAWARGMTYEILPELELTHLNAQKITGSCGWLVSPKLLESLEKILHTFDYFCKTQQKSSAQTQYNVLFQKERQTLTNSKLKFD